MHTVFNSEERQATVRASQPKGLNAYRKELNCNLCEQSELMLEAIEINTGKRIRVEQVSCKW